MICPIKQLFRCFHLTFQRCPPCDSGSRHPPASYSQWSSRYTPAINWTGDRGADGVSIELPPADLRTNPPNGEADGWLTTSIDIPPPAHPPLSHLLHLFLIPVACSALYPSLLFPLFYAHEDVWIFFSCWLLKQLIAAWVLNLSWALKKFRVEWGLTFRRGRPLVSELGPQICQTYSAQRAGISSPLISSPSSLFFFPLFSHRLCSMKDTSSVRVASNGAWWWC